jgi:hypothetical protein
MKSTLSAALVLGTTLVLQSGCSSWDVIAPRVSEPLDVALSVRPPVAGETIPSIHVQTGPLLYVRVTTQTPGCAPVVTAGIKRTSDEITIVSHVSPNPAAQCLAVVTNNVLDYSGSIDGLALGTYRVRVFEARGDQPPRFIGSVVASTSPAY